MLEVRHSTAYKNRKPAKLSLFGLLSLYRSRSALKNLTDEQLQDVGISRIEAAEEAKKPLWDVPDWWAR